MKAAAVLAGVTATPPIPAPRPHIVLMVGDDVGTNDVG